MKTNHRKALNAYAMIQRMAQKVTGRTAFALFKLKQELAGIVQFQREEELKLVEKYGGSIDEKGSITIPDDEKRKEFLKEFNALGEVECEINQVEIQIDSIPEITMQEIETLDGFVKFI